MATGFQPVPRDLPHPGVDLTLRIATTWRGGMCDSYNLKANLAETGPGQLAGNNRNVETGSTGFWHTGVESSVESGWDMAEENVTQEIEPKAVAHAEALVYSLNNPYLTLHQKAQVEAVYQFSFGVLSYAFAGLTLLADQSIGAAYLNASIVGAVAWLISRYMMVGKLYLPLSVVLAGNGSTLIHLALASYAVWSGRWGVGIALGLEAFGLLSWAMLPAWLWPMLFGGKMNPKYRIAKRMFGIIFPFERTI